MEFTVEELLFYMVWENLGKRITGLLTQTHIQTR